MFAIINRASLQPRSARKKKQKLKYLSNQIHKITRVTVHGGTPFPLKYFEKLWVRSNRTR